MQPVKPNFSVGDAGDSHKSEACEIFYLVADCCPLVMEWCLAQPVLQSFLYAPSSIKHFERPIILRALTINLNEWYSMTTKPYPEVHNILYVHPSNDRHENTVDADADADMQSFIPVSSVLYITLEPLAESPARIRLSLASSMLPAS
ncbi:hypothetical protein IW261DRAFT_1574360 [Armillaria novae-zelandiae]|uniref:Uncharacterized protein n=1 Tax=Armillaria novae-zelandiae TaxID=153914 RepID=A0AA39NJ45_9AGAR|nr:hypothetical protein IW261DRAFT_1574360 [Armillaria novae-zelandiae]